jgi:hypothetical protein
MAVTSDHYAARPAFQEVSKPSAEFLKETADLIGGGKLTYCLVLRVPLCSGGFLLTVAAHDRGGCRIHFHGAVRPLPRRAASSSRRPVRSSGAPGSRRRNRDR